MNLFATDDATAEIVRSQKVLTAEAIAKAQAPVFVAFVLGEISLRRRAAMREQLPAPEEYEIRYSDANFTLATVNEGLLLLAVTADCVASLDGRKEAVIVTKKGTQIHLMEIEDEMGTTPMHVTKKVG